VSAAATTPTASTANILVIFTLPPLAVTNAKIGHA
jgi:hypothetical protein